MHKEMIKKKNTKVTVEEYMDYATAHGIGRVKNSPYLILKILWVLAVLTAIAVVALQLTRLTEKWKSHPISTRIELKTRNEIRFPAVTLCNLNPLKYSLVQEDSTLMRAVLMAAKKWGVSLDQFEEDGNYNGTLYNTTEEVDEFDIITGYEKNITGYRMAVDSMQEYFRIKMMALDPELVGNLSHQLHDLLVACTFNGMPCSLDYFYRYLSYAYGTCYTFGLKEDKETEGAFTVFAGGKDHGLSMILNAEQEEYLPFITDAAGLIVSVHSPDILPYETEYGVIVSPGFKTEIAVKIEEYDRIPGPEGRCDKDNVFENLAECHQACFIDLIPSRCGCSIGPEDFPDLQQDTAEEDMDPENDVGADGVKPCESTNDTFCILDTKMKLGFGKLKCHECLTPCRQTKYSTSLTTATWPAEQYRPVLETILRFYSSDYNYSVADVRMNMAKVTIYFPSFTVQTVIEEEAYTDENFVSDIGGQLGLWIGFSVLSLCELVELVFLIISSCFNRKVDSK